MKSLLVVLAASFLAAVPLPAAPAPYATPETAWQSLFNGKDLDGWKVRCQAADKEWEKTAWKVRDGAIEANTTNGLKHDYIWLESKKEYTNFILRLRFQAFRGNPGNSGVQIRSRYDAAAEFMDGPQVDINPPAPWRTGMIYDETRGVRWWLHPKVAKGKWVEEAMAKPGLKFYYQGEGEGWNDLGIVARGSRIRVTLNGMEVTDYDGAGVLDDAVHQEKQVGMAGHIALQIHTGDNLRIRYKDIKLIEIR